MFTFPFAILLLINSRSFSQTSEATRPTPGQDTVKIPLYNSILTGFDQTLTTASWNGIAALNWDTNDFQDTLSEIFHSVVIRGQQNLIRDEENFWTQMRRKIFGNVYGFGQFQSGYVSDNSEIGLNSVGTSTILGGLQFATGKDTALAGIGNDWDRQAGVSNSGFTYSLHGATVFSPTEGTQLVPSLTLQDDEILPRRSYDKSAAVVYSQAFSPHDSLSFFGAYGSQLRDFYLLADSSVQRAFGITNNIQDRTETVGSFGGQLTMPILFFQLNAQSSFSQQQVQLVYRYKTANDPTDNYDTRIQFSNFNAAGSLLSNVFNDTLAINMVHSERTETHGLLNVSAVNSIIAQEDSDQAQLNSVGTTNTLAAQLLLHFGNISSNLTGLASLFRYDTPSDQNFDDRDELTNTVALVVSDEFSPFFNAGFGIETDLTHIVYIDAQRSANNNRNLVYKLFPIIAYSDSRFSSFNRFEVLANYTVYDYEAFSQVHSFSFRQASFLDSTTANITSRISAFFLTDTKLYARGELDWASFSEYPLNYFVDQTLWFSLLFGSGAIRYGAGYKYLSLTQYDYATAVEKQFASQQTSSGPTAFISMNMSHLQLKMDGWYQVSKQTLQNPVVYPNFELTVRYII
ncbi:MAG: hypothetical protein ACLP05_13230 [Candidatus Kryptoniota bacterium]